MAETPAQRRIRYLRDRQLKGRRHADPYAHQARPSTGGFWSGDAKQLAQRRQSSVTRGNEKGTEFRFIDETINVQRREFTQALQSRIRELRARLDAMSPAERALMEDGILETIRKIREMAHQRRLRFIQYRSTQRDTVRTAISDKRNMEGRSLR